MKKEYEDFLIERGFGETILKKNARILWQCENGQMINLIVGEFTTPGEHHHLYDIYSFDIGNCLSDWEDWTLSDVLIKIFVSYIVPVDLRIKILFQLTKIKEFRDDLAFWIWRNAH